MARQQKSQDSKTIILVILLIAAVYIFFRVGALDRYINFFQGAAPQSVSTKSTVQNVPEQNEEGYVYSKLSAADREKYLIVLDAFKTRQARTYPNGDIDDLSRIRDCVLADHPELFYVSNVEMKKRSSGFATEVSIEGSYLYSVSETFDIQAQLDAITAECLGGLPEGADDYSKAKHIFEYVVGRVEYDYDAAAQVASGVPVGQTLVDALVNRKAVCSGYAHAYQYLLKKAGLQGEYVTGKSKGMNHAWCVALLDGEWYHIDPTWGDPRFLNDPVLSDSGFVNYDYLCVNDTDIAATHKVDSSYPVPSCTATADNYYIREGLFLQEADLVRVSAIIDSAAARGDSAACFRCSDTAVMDRIVLGLAGSGSIPSILNRPMKYSTDEDMHTVKLFFV